MWLAKRGITFVAPTRVGRWNFLAPTKDGSWESVPLGQRMPIFERSQTAHWTGERLHRQARAGSGGPASGAVSRVPKPGTLLDKQLLAATGGTFIEGYRLALEKAIPDRAELARSVLGHVDRRLDALSAGEILHARRLSGLGHQHDRARRGRRPSAQPATTTTSTSPRAVRVRERGLDDFEFYTKEIDPQTRAKWWQAAQRNPRFKSTEDPPMQIRRLGHRRDGDAAVVFRFPARGERARAGSRPSCRTCSSRAFRPRS